MAIFTAIATAVATAVGGGILGTIVGSLFAGALAIGASRLIAKRMLRGANAGGDGGGRVQLPPATDNKIPVVYGSAFLGGPIIDAYLTPDQKTMYYVIALAEKTDNGTISFGNIYYDGKLVEWAGGQTSAPLGTAVQALITNNSSPGSAQRDTRPANKINMWFYNNGSSSPTNSASNAYDIFPKWLGNPNYAMTNCAFVVVSVNYNTDAGTTNLGALTVQVINTESGQSTGVYRPGTAIYDYMTNTRYGCAIPANKVEDVTVPGTSLYELNQYSDELITYVPVGGGSATQARYRLNGPLDTATNCLDNLQLLVDSCDSWLQYSELTGEWKVVINKPYTGTMYQVTSSNLITGIQIAPLDLNETYNQLEVAYPNANIKDQTDYQVLDLDDYQAGIMSPNEAVNRLNMTLPLVNNAVQAKYLGLRRLLQSREDLVISFILDFSGIQIEAGDVIQVTHETYGWPNKEFRVSSVVEEKTAEGNLQAQIEAFEYNPTIYNDNSIEDFVPAFNTGLLDPNVFDAPIQPIVYTGNIANASTTSFNVEGTVPPNGVITYMDFNYGTSSNTQTHLLYRTLQPGTGQTFTSGGNVVINVNDVAAGNLYWSLTARNDFAGRTSVASNVYAWAGPAVSNYNPNTGTGGIGGNNIQPNSISANQFITGLTPIQTVNTLPVCNANTIGQTVYLTTDGKLYNCNGTSFVPTASNTLITGNIIANQIGNVFANTVFGNLLNANLPNANIIGQLVASQIANVSNTAIIGQIVSSQIANVANTAIIGEIVAGQIANAAITSDKIAANAVIAEKIFANAVTAVKIAAGSVEADKIAANAVTSDKIFANAVTAVKIAAGSIDADKIAANAVTANAIAANAIIAGKIAADAVGANQIIANSITTAKIAANAITATQINANAVTSDAIFAGAVTAGKIAVTQLDAISAAMGTLTSGTIQTGTSPANRVEISSSGNFPLWYGNGTKDAANARFYLDTTGNAYFAGTLSAAGGTINIDAGAVSNGGAFGILKGSQFLFCRDGDNVVFPVPYPSGTASRVSVVFIGGGLTYDASLSPPLFQSFNALNVTETGFTADLKLSEAFGSNSLSSQTDSFGGGISVNKSIANVAYDNRYIATFSANVLCDNYIPPYNDGFISFGDFYIGGFDVSLVCDTGSGNSIISPQPVGAYAIREGYLGPGYATVSNLYIEGTVINAGLNSDFYLEAQAGYYGGPNGSVIGANLDYTYSTTVANTVSATPTGVPAVVALVYLQ